MDKQIKSEYIVPMLDRALLVLRYLYEHEGSCGIGEISSQLGLAKATTFRILYTLQQYNFVMKNKDDRYSLGLAFISYGSQLKKQRDLFTSARPLMEDMAQAIGEGVNIGIRVEDNIVVLDSVPGEDFFIAKHLIPTTPMYCSAMGKIFIAQMDDQELDRYLESQDFKKRTVSTITDPQVLRKELIQIRKSQLAYDREEYTYGLTCVASGVYHKGQLLAAVSISGPTSRIYYRGIGRIEDAIQQLAASIQSLPDLHNLLVF